jgi:hypothetical protein
LSNIFIDKNELREYLLERDARSFTALHHPLLNESIEMIPIAIRIYEKFFGILGIQEIILNKNLKITAKLFIDEISMQSENVNVIVEYLSNLFKGENIKLMEILLLKSGKGKKTIFDKLKVKNNFLDPLIETLLNDQKIDKTEFIMRILISNSFYLDKSASIFDNDVNLRLLEERFKKNPEYHAGIISRLAPMEDFYFHDYCKIENPEIAEFSLKSFKLFKNQRSLEIKLKTEEHKTSPMRCA